MKPSPIKNTNRIILVDADLISHFITAGEEQYIHLIFPNNPIHLLDKVHAELQNWKNKQVGYKISNLLSGKFIRLIDFPENDEAIKKEYFYIKKILFKGDGESACLAVARHNKNVLASSNLKDISTYCHMHKIDYLTTMDFLCAAINTGIFDEERCNLFITTVKNAGSKLPVTNMRDHNCKNIDFL